MSYNKYMIHIIERKTKNDLIVSANKLGRKSKLDLFIEEQRMFNKEQRAFNQYVRDVFKRNNLK